MPIYTNTDLLADLDGIPGPWGEGAWGDLGDGQDLTWPDPIEALRDYDGELQWLLRIKAWDPNAAAESPVLVSTHGYQTLGDGAAASSGLEDFTHFPPGLANPGSTKETILSGGRIKAGATPTHGGIRVANADGRFDSWLDLHFRRRPYDQWVGPALWAGPSFSQFARVRSGLIEDITWNEKEISLSTRNPKEQVSIDVNPAAYLGFGTAVRLRASGDGVTIDANASYNPARCHFRVVVHVLEIQNAVLLNYGWKDADRRGWELRMLADGSVLWVQDDYAPYVLTPGGLITAGQTHRISWEGGPSGVAIYVDGIERARDSQAYTASVSVNAASAPLLVGRRAI